MHIYYIYIYTYIHLQQSNVYTYTYTYKHTSCINEYVCVGVCVFVCIPYVQTQPVSARPERLGLALPCANRPCPARLGPAQIGSAQFVFCCCSLTSPEYLVSGCHICSYKAEFLEVHVCLNTAAHWQI